jgi:cytochrome oxidase Cu insertion factor (SCO1/SenC/PrrC family)
MDRRRVAWLITGAGAALVLCAMLVAPHLGTSFAGGRQTSDQQAVQRAYQEGTNLGGDPAPAFTLHDQTGTAVALDQLRGRPVVLTFFDSVCPHADCSLMAQYLNWTAKDLGAPSASVNWAAISVNPWHDTPASVRTFLSAHQVTMPLHYLLGTPTELASVWSAYHMQALLQPDGVVIHTTGVYVLDAQGRERLFLDEGFDPKVLSDYLRVLLKEPANAAVPQLPTTASQVRGTVTQTEVVDGETIALTATPGQYGTYTFTVEVQDKQGTPLQGATVTMALSMPSMRMEVLQVGLPPIKPPVPGAYQARGVLSMAGEWQAVVQVQAKGAAQPSQATFLFTTVFQ